MRWRSRRSGTISQVRSGSAAAAPGAGGSSSSPNCTWARTSSCPTWRAGAERGCRTFPMRLSARWRRTGCARCSRPRPASSTWMASARSTRGRGGASVARRTGGSHSGGVRAARRGVGADRDGEGRRPGTGPPLRGDHVQPRRSVALSRPSTAVDTATPSNHVQPWQSGAINRPGAGVGRGIDRPGPRPFHPQTTSEPAGRRRRRQRAPDVRIELLRAVPGRRVQWRAARRGTTR